jgi:hypothetical protein
LQRCTCSQPFLLHPLNHACTCTLITQHSGIDAIIQMEARIRTVVQSTQQDVTLLKVARNALIPIVRLPSELLVRLAQQLLELTNIEDVPQVLIAFTSVCSRIRAELVDASVLWSRFGFHGESHRRKAVRDLFLARAGSYPLAISVGDAWGEPSNLRKVAKHLPRTKSLSAYLRTSIQAVEFVSVLQVTNMPLLETLELIGWTHTAIGPIGTDILPPTSCANLDTLHLDAVHIATFPLLPSLRVLHLRSTNTPVQQVKNLILRTPGLVSVTLRFAMRCDPSGEDAVYNSEPEPSLARHITDSFNTLIVQDALVHASDIVGILPIPSRVFDVEIVADDTAAPVIWSSSIGHLGVIVSRMKQFSLSTKKSDRPFPFGGEVTWERVPEGYRYQIRYDRGGLRFSTPCRIELPDPTLSEMTTLRVSISRWYGMPTQHDTIVDNLLLPWLSGVENVIIEVMYNEALIKSDQPRMQILEDWILARHRAGRPLVSVEFASCPYEMMNFFVRIKAQQAAVSVTWCDEDESVSSLDAISECGCGGTDSDIPSSSGEEGYDDESSAEQVSDGERVTDERQGRDGEQDALSVEDSDAPSPISYASSSSESSSNSF